MSLKEVITTKGVNGEPVDRSIKNVALTDQELQLIMRVFDRMSRVANRMLRLNTKVTLAEAVDIFTKPEWADELDASRRPFEFIWDFEDELLRGLEHPKTIFE